MRFRGSQGITRFSLGLFLSVVLGGCTETLRTDRSLLWLISAFMLVQGIAILGLIVNIRRRRRAEKDLRESEARYRDLVELSPLPIFVHHDARFLYLNPSAVRALGANRPQELRGREVAELVHADCRVAFREQMATGDNRLQEQRYLELRLVRLDGQVIDIQAIGMPVTFAGKAAQLVTFLDVTERKRAEGELAIFRRFAEAAGYGFGMADLEGKMLYANPALRRLLGEDHPEATVGNDFNTYFPPEVAEDMKARTIPALLERGHWMGEVDILSKDGRRTPTVQNVFLVYSEVGAPPRLAGLVIDITERKRAEEELARHRNHLEELVRARTAELEAAQKELVRQERLATLGRLVAVVSHELRNPLGTIRGSLDVIGQRLRGQDFAATRALRRAERNIVRCDGIIEELLTYTRLQGLDRVVTFMDEWLAEILDELQLPPGIAAVRRLDSSTKVSIDRERYRRCLLNVITNACQAMEEEEEHHGRPPVRQLTIESRTNDGRLEVIVLDTGPGMPAERLERVFEPLFSTKSFGVGLGLSIVKQIMDQHGGRVDIASQLGEGTMVTLSFPIGDDE